MEVILSAHAVFDAKRRDIDEDKNKMKADHLKKYLLWLVNYPYQKQLENDIKNFLES